MLRKGLATAGGDVLHVLHPGDVFEPGGVLRVAEYFARHTGVQAVYSEDAIYDRGTGWTSPAPPQSTADVYQLLTRRSPFRNGVFFRKWAYEALGPVKPELGSAAEWEWWLRLARRFGLRRLDGHARSIPIALQDAAGGDAVWREDVATHPPGLRANLRRGRSPALPCH